jgi:hypothetical protein
MYDYNELLAKWDIRIKNMSRNLYHHYREIIGYSIDDNDIAQQLRMSLVRAVDKYDNEKGDIENYINRTLKYECILVLQEQHRDLPKTKEGLLYRVDSEDVDILSTIEDLESSNGVEEFELLDYYNYELGIIRQALKQRYFKRQGIEYFGLNEVEVFDAILSSKYDKDKELSKELNIDWVKVGEVKQMMRVGICLLNNWDVWNFTREVEIIKVVKRFRKRLLSITKELATVEEVIPGLDIIDRYKKMWGRNVNRIQLDKIISNYHKARGRKDATV